MFRMRFRGNIYWAEGMKKFYHYLFYAFYSMNIKLRPYFRIEFQAACWLLGILIGTNLISFIIIFIKFFSININYSLAFFIVPIGISVFNEYYFGKQNLYIRIAKSNEYRKKNMLKLFMFAYIISSVLFFFFALKI
jgi:hypothetical protein